MGPIIKLPYSSLERYCIELTSKIFLKSLFIDQTLLENKWNSLGNIYFILLEVFPLQYDTYCIPNG